MALCCHGSRTKTNWKCDEMWSLGLFSIVIFPGTHGTCTPKVIVDKQDPVQLGVLKWSMGTCGYGRAMETECYRPRIPLAMSSRAHVDLTCWLSLNKHERPNLVDCHDALSNHHDVLSYLRNDHESWVMAGFCQNKQPCDALHWRSILAWLKSSMYFFIIFLYLCWFGSS